MEKLRASFVSALWAAGLLIGLNCSWVRADDDDTLSTTRQSAGDSRYGWFDLLDRRSKYGTDWFPEPFRVDDSDVGNEIRFDWEHDETRRTVSNTVELQVEKSFGLVTFEIQAPYVIDSSARVDGIAEEADDTGGKGFGNISISARAPVWQFVSASESFDNTLGAEFELGIPSNAPDGKNAEAAPGLFDDLRIGEHFSVQSLFSLSWNFGKKPQGGAREFGYAMAFGYSIEDEEFKVPDVERLTPSVELLGETRLDGSSAGHNSLTGTVGIRAELKPIGRLQPQLGLAYVFPIDQGGREDLKWGVITSVAFEY